MLQVFNNTDHISQKTLSMICKQQAESVQDFLNVGRLAQVSPNCAKPL